MDTVSAFKILKISGTVSKKDIKKAYKKCSFTAHPDQGGKVEDFEKMKRAYDFLLLQNEDPIQGYISVDYNEKSFSFSLQQSAIEILAKYISKSGKRLTKPELFYPVSMEIYEILVKSEQEQTSNSESFHAQILTVIESVIAE